VQLAYSSESEKLEISDYYDFSSSYAGPAPRRRKRRVDPKALDQVKEGEEWEDEEMADDEEVGSDVEVVEDDGYESDEMGSDYTDASLDDDHPDAPTFDPETFELVLPSGRRIGHRSLLPYYKQRPSQPRETSLDLVPVEKRTIAGRTDQALIPARGGFGDFGRGGEVVKARNKGEAKNAMKHPYREMQKREQFKTRVGYIANSQKHWRDHLRESACDFTFLLSDELFADLPLVPAPLQCNKRLRFSSLSPATVRFLLASTDPSRPSLARPFRSRCALWPTSVASFAPCTPCSCTRTCAPLLLTGKIGRLGSDMSVRMKGGGGGSRTRGCMLRAQKGRACCRWSRRLSPEGRGHFLTMSTSRPSHPA
jgi:hypothetical protein